MNTSQNLLKFKLLFTGSSIIMDVLHLRSKKVSYLQQMEKNKPKRCSRRHPLPHRERGAKNQEKSYQELNIHPPTNLPYNFSQNLHVDIKNKKLTGLELCHGPGRVRGE